jgi:hypothetical protein
LKKKVEEGDSEFPENYLIELALIDVGLEYIPKRSICMKKYYMRQPRGSYMGLNTSVKQFVERLNDLSCSQETIYWVFNVDDRSDSSSTYDMIIGNQPRSPWSIRHNHELQ